MLGVKVSDVLEQLIKDFIEKTRNQTSLDVFNDFDTKTIYNINISNVNMNRYLLLAKLGDYGIDIRLKQLEQLENLPPHELNNWQNREFLVKTITEGSKLLHYAPPEYQQQLYQLIDKASRLLEKILNNNNHV